MRLCSGAVAEPAAYVVHTAPVQVSTDMYVIPSMKIETCHRLNSIGQHGDFLCFFTTNDVIVKSGISYRYGKSVCPSVCQSVYLHVTLQHCAKTGKRIFSAW